jgi:protein transport protein SEC13
VSALSVSRFPPLILIAVNSIAWAPYDLGPILACASSDGKISVINFQNDGSTDASVFAAHGTGANAISWAPSAGAGAAAGGVGQGQGNASANAKRFVSAGSDNLIKIWAWDDEAKKWAEEETIREHEDWVRDVAWAPNIGLPGSYIASASQVSASECKRAPASAYSRGGEGAGTGTGGPGGPDHL